MPKILLKIFTVFVVLLTISITGLYAYWRYGLVTTTELREGVYLLSVEVIGKSQGANVMAVDTSEGWLVVDTQLPLMARPIKVALQNIHDQPVHTTIVTHWHPDHSGGNAVLGENAVRLAHQQSLLWMSTVQEAHGLTAPDSFHRFNSLADAALPNETYSEDTSLNIGGMTIKLVHPNAAHTGGDTIIVLPAQHIIHLGDILWPDAFTFADTEHGGSVIGTLNVLENYADLEPNDTLYVSGHGRMMDAKALRNHVVLLRRAYDDIQARLAAGSTPEDLRNAEFPDYVTGLETPLIPAWRWAEMIAAESD